MSSPAPNVPPQCADGSLEIHHVYVGHGDATVIAIWDEDNGSRRCVYKALIDASTSNGFTKLTWYFANTFRDCYFDLVIASHYHDDHIRGLAEGLGTSMHAKLLLDIGGYDLTGIESNKGTDKPSNKGTAVPHANPPAVGKDAPYVPKTSGLWKQYLKNVKDSAQREGDERLSRHPYNFPDDFNTPITLATIKGVPVTLTCYAANGFVFDPFKTAERHTGGTKNPNNYGLAFILQYGAFRYYTGGDLGGSKGAYYDHESLLSATLKQVFPASGKAPAGHVCAFKSNHHGSNHSNNDTFLQGMTPTVCITSVGQHRGHGLPGTQFLDRLAKTKSPSGLQGFFFTDLLPGRRAKAKALFGTRFEDGGGAAYFIRVSPAQANATPSEFSVYRFVIPNIPVQPPDDAKPPDDEDDTDTDGDTIMDDHTTTDDEQDTTTDDNGDTIMNDAEPPDDKDNTDTDGDTIMVAADPEDEQLVLQGLVNELSVGLGRDPGTINASQSLSTLGLVQTHVAEFSRRVSLLFAIHPSAITLDLNLTLKELAEQIVQMANLPHGAALAVENNPMPTPQLVHTFKCH